MSNSHRTIVYIDGYNFYYGRLKGTPYKWLDVVKLFENSIINQQLPTTRMTLVKFFTADVLNNFSSSGSGQQMQQRYHNALTTLYPDKLTIIKGYHSVESVWMPKCEDVNTSRRVDKKNAHKVWRLNEKQTDVNIALHLYRDALQGKADSFVVCSSDSDLEPALQIIKDAELSVKVGIVFPSDGSLNTRPPNKRLSDLADWTRSHIRDDELLASQLPPKIATKKKPIIKPDYW